jgi:hypothetical protein
MYSSGRGSHLIGKPLVSYYLNIDNSTDVLRVNGGVGGERSQMTLVPSFNVDEALFHKLWWTSRLTKASG